MSKIHSESDRQMSFSQLCIFHNLGRWEVFRVLMMHTVDLKQCTHYHQAAVSAPVSSCTASVRSCLLYTTPATICGGMPGGKQCQWIKRGRRWGVGTIWKVINIISLAYEY